MSRTEKVVETVLYSRGPRYELETYSHVKGWQRIYDLSGTTPQAYSTLEVARKNAVEWAELKHQDVRIIEVSA